MLKIILIVFVNVYHNIKNILFWPRLNFAEQNSGVIITHKMSFVQEIRRVADKDARGVETGVDCLFIPSTLSCYTGLMFGLNTLTRVATGITVWEVN